MEHTILVVEDEQGIREAIGIYMKNQGYNVILAANGKEGLEKIETNDIHLAIVDIMMPVMDGIQTLVKIKEYDPGAKVIMVTAAGQKGKMVDAIKLGAAEFVTKPFETDQIISIIESIEE